MSALMATYGRLPMNVARGDGLRLWDTEGREYLDALTGIAVCALGHAHPAVAKAISEQANTLIHSSNLYKIPNQEQLGADLCRLANMDKVFFANSGAEANEACIKLARLHAHSRGIDHPQIVVFDNAFHGRTMATLSATGNDKIKAGFGPMVDGFLRVPYDDAAAVEALAKSRQDIAAILVEPIQGEGGVHIPADDYLPALRKICDDNHWLLITDEIQAGMGRTGHWFAHQHSGVTPDVVAVAKALGNGMPIGGCLARGAAAELMQPGSHGSTFGGNPLACSAALAVINTMERDDLPARAKALGDRMLEGFRAALHNQPGVADIRGRGMMMGIELDRDCAELMNIAMQEHGVLLNVTAARVIRLLPPYIMSDEDADLIVSRVSKLVTDFLNNSESAPA